MHTNVFATTWRPQYRTVQTAYTLLATGPIQTVWTVIKGCLHSEYQSMWRLDWRRFLWEYRVLGELHKAKAHEHGTLFCGTASLVRYFRPLYIINTRTCTSIMMVHAASRLHADDARKRTSMGYASRGLIWTPSFSFHHQLHKLISSDSVFLPCKKI